MKTIKVNRLIITSTQEVLETTNSRNWLRKRALECGDSKPRDWRFEEYQASIEEWARH